MEDLLGVQLGLESEHESSGRVPIIIESEIKLSSILVRASLFIGSLYKCYNKYNLRIFHGSCMYP